jgi:endonuclease III
MARRHSETWRHPPRRRVAAIRDRLRAYYGRPRNEPHRAPLDELVLTVLSQNTNDRNRDIAYARLRERFHGWGEVAAAPATEIEEAIRPGGISKVKSKRILQILEAVERHETRSRRPPDRRPADRRPVHALDWLEDASREEALRFLEGLPGVGRKTAACVLLFSYDRPELPVDTHVYRVASRLELIPARASFERAHEELREITDPNDAYELHVNMLRHGRRLCRPRAPLCAECPLLGLCPYGRARVAASA